MEEKLCCAEAPKRALGDLTRENTGIIRNIEELSKSLGGFFFNEEQVNKEESEIKCMYEEVEIQNYKLKNILENLSKIRERLG